MSAEKRAKRETRRTLREAMESEEVDKHIERLLADAPPLTPEQIRRLARLLRP
jgi:hypothetical protein